MADSFPSSSLALADHPIFPAPTTTPPPSPPCRPSSSSCLGVAREDTFEEDACSICLEPFTTLDPSTVTSCKHEYHLQCVLEWSQRSKECPICSQLLVLKDPSSQQLLVAVEAERKLGSMSTSHAAPTDLHNFNEELDLEDSCSEDSDLDEHIMHHLAAATGRAHYFHGRERQRFPGPCPSQVFVFSPTADGPNQEVYNSAEGSQNENFGPPGVNSLAPGVPTVGGLQPVSSLVLPVVNVDSSAAVNGDGSFKPWVFFKQPPADTAQGSGSSDLSSFSSTIKSKWSLASARYKDSITKGACGIKEKLAARNYSVKEFSKGFQREMSAGIASVGRMMERLDLTPNRNATSTPDVTGSGSFSLKGKSLQETTIVESLDKASVDIACGTTSPAPSHVLDTVSSQLQVTHAQSGP